MISETVLRFELAPAACIGAWKANIVNMQDLC